MADILIRGMEMPKYTTKAEFGIDADGNPLCMVYADGENEPEIYDVVPLPEKHGRLGDLDALYEVAKTRSMGIYGPCNAQCVITGDDILKAHTIVPAEGGTDNG